MDCIQSANQSSLMVIDLYTGRILEMDGGLRIQQRHHKTTVGAGLLAKAADQTTDELNDTPPSRASPLPQWIAFSQLINRL
ncbi:hypothetical protein [Pseudomonas sp. H1h]|uniref:hypothetical protein n=1 Tax=Pseudomonas sp. H1h TaxID=1397280 RepID=UPI0012FE84C5|nr:hypothetical protein [Pseudomonas sp. H1h]